MLKSGSLDTAAIGLKLPEEKRQSIYSTLYVLKKRGAITRGKDGQWSLKR